MTNYKSMERESDNNRSKWDHYVWQGCEKGIVKLDVHFDNGVNTLSLSFSNNEIAKLAEEIRLSKIEHMMITATIGAVDGNSIYFVDGDTNEKTPNPKHEFVHKAICLLIGRQLNATTVC